MPNHTLSPTKYVSVLVVLLLLTILTLSVSFIPLTGIWHIVVGLLVAVAKASLVVLFFMHAITSSRVTWIVIAVACFWPGILFVLTLSDYLARGMLPHMPGH